MMKAMILVVSTLCSVVTVGQTQLTPPFTIPGQVLPELTIKDIINAAGAAWRADNLVEALGRVCVDIGPSTTVIIDPRLIQLICDPVLTALRNNANVDAELACRNVFDTIDLMSGNYGGAVPNDTIDDSSLSTTWPFNPDPLGPTEIPYSGVEALRPFDIIGILTNISHDLYGLTGYDKDSVCPTVNTVLNSGKTVPDLISGFGIALLKAVIPRAAEMCDSWDDIYAQLIPSIPAGFELPEVQAQQAVLKQLVNDTSTLIAQLSGFVDREALCVALTTTVAANDTGVLENLASSIMNNMLSPLTNSSRCTSMTNDVFDLLVDTVPEITHANLNVWIPRYTGLTNVGNICQSIASAFSGSGLMQPTSLPSEWYVDWIAEYQQLVYYQNFTGPFTNPGEVLPQLRITDIIDAAGEAWRADDLVEAMGHVCVNIAPSLIYVAGGVHPIQDVCDPVLIALRTDADVDAEAACRNVWDTIGSSGNYEEMTSNDTTMWPSYSDAVVPTQVPFLGIEALRPFDIVASFTEIAQDLYGLTSYDKDIICRVVDNVLNSGKTLPDLVTGFGIELLKVLIPRAAEICDSWDEIYAALLPRLPPGTEVTPEIQAERALVARLLNDYPTLIAKQSGFLDRGTLCLAVTTTVAANDTSVLNTLATDVMNNVLSSVINSSRCISVTNGTFDLLVDIVPEITQNILNVWIHQYTGLASVEDVCQYIDSAFTDRAGEACQNGLSLDACGFCEPLPRDGSAPSSVSSHMDCNNMCEGDADFGAAENECDECVGGTTGRNTSYGIDQCNQCERMGSIPTSCLGCDGVPFSGQEVDACGECGGDGTTCIAVNMVLPNFIPENSNYQLMLNGAGFQTAATPQCVFVDGSVWMFSAVENIIGTKFTCNANLATGTYNVHLSLDGNTLSEGSLMLYVYPAISVNSISSTEFDIDPSLDRLSVTMTATNGAFTAYRAIAVPFLIVNTNFQMRTGVYAGAFDEQNDILVFSWPMPRKSSRRVLYPSLNKINPLTTPNDAGFTVTVYAAAPVVTNLTFSNMGNTLNLAFDRSISSDTAIDCNALFTNTAKLGPNSVCSLRNRRKIVIEIDEDGTDLIQPGDTLTLVENVIKSYDEDYSRTAAGNVMVGGPISPVRVVASLRGATTISSCGEVALSARGSTGAAGRDVQYAWVVQTSGTVSTELTTAVNNEDGSELSIPGNYLDTDVSYTFVVTVTNFFAQSDDAEISVIRSAEVTPDFQITTRGVDPRNVLLSKSFYLQAEVSFSAECGGAGTIVFSWSVDNDDVTLDGRTRNRRALYIGAFSLPGNTEVTFSVRVHKSSEPSKVTTQSITVRTAYSDLVAGITGGKERSVGVDSGTLELDGSASHDPDRAAGSLTYMWTCLQVTDFVACRSRRNRNELFPSTDSSSLAVLTVNTDAMEPSKDYRFTLEVRKGNRIASAGVLVSALAGNPPEVLISSSTDDKVIGTEPLTIMALIHHTSPVTIVWETVDLDQGNGFIALNDVITNVPFGSSTLSYITIAAVHLAAGESYTFQVTATDSKGQAGITQVPISVYSGVSSCRFSLGAGNSAYTELDEITFVTDNCVTDADAYPLSYQLLVWRDDDGTPRSLTEARSESSFQTIGLPSRQGSQANTFQNQVCNQHGSCSSFTSEATVNPIQSLTQATFDDLKARLVDEEVMKGYYLDALINFNVLRDVVDNQSRARKRRAAVTSTVANQQLNLLRNAINSTVLHTSSAQTLLDQCEFVSVADLSLAGKGDFLDILTDLVAVFIANNKEVPTYSAQIVLGKIGEIAFNLNPTDNVEMFTNILDLIDSVVEAQLNGKALGAPAAETTSTYAVTSALHAIPSGTFTSHSGAGAFHINFGDELERLYGVSWSCGEGTCTGVNIKFVQYNIDYYSLTADDRDNRGSEILDITLYDPSTSNELNVADLTTPVRINMTVTEPKNGEIYQCYYWDTTTNQWSSDGMASVTLSDTVVECRANHLTAFVLLEVEETMPTTAPPGNTKTVIIIVVVVGVLVIVAVTCCVIVYIKRNGKRNTSSMFGDMGRTGQVTYTKTDDGGYSGSEGEKGAYDMKQL